jgi:uncharacterized membrane protein HdeD (DUF308 family)
MLIELAIQWSLLLLRGIAGVFFGIVILLWPGLTLEALTILFGAYVAVDGLTALITALLPHGAGLGGLLFEGIVGLAAAATLFFYPGLSSPLLLMVIAVWALLAGAARIASAIVLNRELSGEWPLPVAGTLSLLLGAMLVAQPGADALNRAWMIGVYAFLSGLLWVAFAVRLREIAREAARV